MRIAILSLLAVVAAVAGAIKFRDFGHVQVMAIVGLMFIALFAAIHIAMLGIGFKPTYSLWSVLTLERVPRGGLLVVIAYGLEVAALGACMRLLVERITTRR